jgi:hypothetical protein
VVNDFDSKASTTKGTKVHEGRQGPTPFAYYLISFIGIMVP